MLNAAEMLCTVLGSAMCHVRAKLWYVNNKFYKHFQYIASDGDPMSASQ